MIRAGRRRVAWWIVVAVVVVLSVVQVAPAQEGILPLAYVTYDEETGYDLYVMDVNSGEIIFNVAEEGYDCPYSISPDGRWLIYSSENIDGRYLYNLYNLETTASREMPVRYSRFNARLRWSPNSQRFAYRNIEYNSRKDDWDYTFYVYDIDFEHLELLSNQLVVSQRFVDNLPMHAALVDEGLVITHGDHSTQIDLIGDYTYRFETEPLSPDGEYIAYYLDTTDAACEQHKRHLYLTTVATGDTIQVSNRDIFSFDWSPDSTLLVYESTDSDGAIFLYDLASQTSVEQPRVGSHYHDFTPRFSPDGRYLSIKSRPDSETDSLRGILSLFDLHTSERQMISDTPVHYGNHQPFKWVSPTLIAYSRIQDDEQPWVHDIWLYDITTQTTTQLTDTPNIDEAFGCSWG